MGSRYIPIASRTAPSVAIDIDRGDSDNTITHTHDPVALAAFITRHRFLTSNADSHGNTAASAAATAAGGPSSHTRWISASMVPASGHTAMFL